MTRQLQSLLELPCDTSGDTAESLAQRVEARLSRVHSGLDSLSERIEARLTATRLLEKTLSDSRAERAVTREAEFAEFLQTLQVKCSDIDKEFETRESQLKEHISGSGV